MAISWDQVEGGEILRDKILGYSKPRFHKIEKYSPKSDQVNFILSFVPTNETVKFDINGLTYYEGIHFNVNRDTDPPTLTWTHTKNKGGFDIEYNDLIYVEYWSFTRA